MIRNRIAIIFILILVFTFNSCTVQRMINIEESTPIEYKNIYGLVTVNNDWIQFGSPGKLANGIIRGVIRRPGGDLEPVSYQVKNVKILWVKRVELFEVIWDVVSISGMWFYFLNPVLTAAGSGLALIIYTL